MIERYEMKNKKYALTLTILSLIFPFFIGSLWAAVVTGAEQTNAYLKLLKGKRVALFSNQSGVVGDKLTLDVLLENHVNVVEIFSPEHGFRGKADWRSRVFLVWRAKRRSRQGRDGEVRHSRHRHPRRRPQVLHLLYHDDAADGSLCGIWQTHGYPR